VLLKPSEIAPATSAALAQWLPDYCDPDCVGVVEGGISETTQLLAQRFDHIIYTGGSRVARIVMTAAAQHLTPVTLELGGKSPCVVLPDANLETAARRIAWGKFTNAGQTCIAPDYVLVPAGSESAFVAEAQRVCARLYPDMAGSSDYASIIDERHYQRLRRCIDEAAADGAEVVRLGPEMPPESRRLAPHLLLGSAALSKGLQKEIFGPILPVVGYRDVDGAIAFVNARPRPLALYLFDRDSARVDRWLRETVAGGVSVNETIMHIVQHNLPFGGVGPSGMGRYHGRDGFDTFSHQKAVFRQSRLAGVALFNPPYGRRFQALIKLVLRF
jgi:acyl-CoA reductase-like NAD-dependent aldehyde dehydrogenase